MAEFEPDKFIVINRKNLGCLNETDYGVFCNIIAQLAVNYEARNGKPLDHKYYVCNQDEPYAQKVLDVILEGEREKETTCDIEKVCYVIDKKYSSDCGQQSGIVKCHICGSDIDYFISMEDGFISFDCTTKNCLSGGTENLRKNDHI